MIAAALAATILAGSLDAPPKATPTPAAVASATPVIAKPGATPAAAAVTPSPIASATPSLPRIGVLVVGDPAAAAPLQKDLERAIGSQPGFFVRMSGELATRLVVLRPAGPAGPDAQTKADAAKLLEDAKAAYYDDASAKALDLLAKLDDLQERTGGFPILSRVETRLWRAAVFLALKDESGAADEALSALSADPDLKIDLKELPPSVNELVEKTRKTRLKVVTVILSGLPPIAEIKVDGRSVPSRFRTVAGHHKLDVYSPGRAEILREFDAATDLSISIPMALAVPEAAAQAIGNGAGGDRSNAAADAAALASLLTKVSVDWIVGVALAGDPLQQRAMIAGPGGSIVWNGEAVPAGSDSAASIAEKVVPRLRNAIAHASKTASIAKTAEQQELGWHLTPAAALAVSGRYREITGSGGQIKTVFAGTGPALGLEAVNGSTRILTTLSWVTYSPSSLAVTLPDGSRRSGTGGSMLTLRSGYSWRHALGANGYADGASIRAGLGVAIEQYATKDVATAGGTRLGLLTPFLRVAPEITGGARLPLGGAAALSADLGVAPIGLWLDTPAKEYGNSTKAALALQWKIAATTGTPGQVQFEAAWIGAMEGADYQGTSKMPTNPAMTGTRVRENEQSVTIGVIRRF